MMDRIEKPRQGRSPKSDEAMDGTSRQRAYLRARRKEASEIARALVTALNTDVARRAFLSTYAADTDKGQLIRRGLAQVLPDDPVTAAFFDRLFRQ